MKRPILFLSALALMAMASCSTVTPSSSPTSSSPEASSSSSAQASSQAPSSSSQSSQEPSSEPSSSSASSSESSSSVAPSREVGVGEGAILHAWNWSMDNIKGELAEIKKAGYAGIQLSPMQPQKDPYNGNWRGQWWKLYQPYGFKVAGNGENVLGNKDSLKALTAAAKKEGLSIIVDVVTNHLAGGSENSFDGRVNDFESTIYSNNLLHGLGRYANDSDLQSIVQGNIGGYPDLKTEDSRVQSRVISMLKEYIDCGISGFRFDAAKHIETDEDGDYASNYWQNVIESTQTYAKQKLGKEAYIYGEILYTPGNNRRWEAYTKRMETVDNKQGSAVLSAVTGKNPGNAGAGYTGCPSDKLVLWAESHDTYANDSRETTDISDSDVNKAYAIQASRKGAAVLYFARPGNSDMGQIGVRDYKSTLISAANQFHNDFIDASENISSDSGCFVNVRKDGNKAGAMIINVNASNNPTVRVELPNGTYTDILSNREFTVSNNQVQASFTSDALMLENFKGGQPSSSVTITPKDYVFKDKTTVTFTCSEAATYQIGSASPVSFQGTKNVEIGAGLSEGEIIVKATCNGKTQQVTLTKTALAEKSFIIYNVPTDDNLLLWGWDKASDSTWIDLTRYKGVLAVDLAKKQYIVVKFPKGVTSQNADWGNKIAQTDDLHNDGVIRLDYSSIAFK